MQLTHRFLNINDIGFIHCEGTIYSNKTFEPTNDFDIQFLSNL